jgi:two-component system, cell cycle sensor histidine kinase and response regulator CckA
MQKSKKILIVDDETPVLNIMGSALIGQGYEVLFATSFSSAMNTFGMHPGEIGLLVADVSLPEKSGFELACCLIERDGELKVLFVSGAAGAEVFKFHQMRVPDDHFLQKPFEINDFVKRVQGIVGPAVVHRTFGAG